MAALTPFCCLSPGPLRAAAAVDTHGVTACAISGWSDDKDPAGLNVRAGPDKSAAIIGRIPPERMQGYESIAAEFDIIGSRDGWLLIRDVHYADYGEGKGDRAVLAGPGWVYADKVRFTINDNDLRGAPDRAARTVMKLITPDHTAGPDSAIIEHVYGCNGAFADILVHLRGPSARGWVTGICSNQVTTCS